jgi:hypothetical protein
VGLSPEQRRAEKVRVLEEVFSEVAVVDELAEYLMKEQFPEPTAVWEAWPVLSKLVYQDKATQILHRLVKIAGRA